MVLMRGLRVSFGVSTSGGKATTSCVPGRQPKRAGNGSIAAAVEVFDDRIAYEMRLIGRKRRGVQMRRVQLDPSAQLGVIPRLIGPEEQMGFQDARHESCAV